jgi:aminoglycoside 3-N-acetyltransferase
MTFYHHVEEVCQVNYRYMKWFESDYLDSSSIVSSRSYSIYVRNLNQGVTTHVNPAGERMWSEGIYRGDRPGVDSGLRIALATEFFDFVRTIILTGQAENILFRYV